ncbi:hypothetical protein ADL15_16655 [Actinoplanes awajinensis subsp. mycoplanecinus]|uniref:Uncharacterized protein n=2 Tax=Actinoplanes awajinensis TaxID=135946 RepID=A0A0X3UNV2_9ACTN|nr:hypothetical protein ADL15_16655 [Actinoplanes awajinensis subsp. mycoplanecinus]
MATALLALLAGVAGCTDHPAPRQPSAAGQEYWMHAACTSTAPGTTLSVEVASGELDASSEALVTAGVPCDGGVTVNDIGPLPAETIAVYLRGDRSDILAAYAVIAPVSSLPKG